MDVENLAKELILKNMTPEQQMAVLDSVRSSVAQAKEVQKRKIGENVDLVVQALKKIESDIRSRFDDVGNSIEKRVASIKDGRDGINGKDGRDGKDGRSGKDGAKGDRGDAGRDGRDGVDGVDGVSVTAARIDFDGSLVITLSSGRELNVGEVVAPDLAERIKVITNGGGTSQSVLDTLASLQTQIDDLIPSQTGNSGKFLTTNGTTLSWGSAVGGLSYQGTWNASTNSPTLASGVGTNGYYYVVGTAGSTNLDGITSWNIGDWVIYNGTAWQKIDQSETLQFVTSADSSVTVTTTGATADLAVYSSPRLIAQVRNETGATLTKGTVVYINGASGNKATVTKALATDDSTSAQTFGLILADISTNNNGYVILAGDIAGLDTSAFTAGQQLYLSSTTAGAYTSTKQYAPNHLVYVGVVTRSHVNQGSIEVRIQNGYEMDELHNVSAQSPSNGQVLIYNESTSLWEKNTLTDGTGISITEGAGSITVGLASGYGDTLNPYASKTANYVLASPNGSAGLPTFRALVAADVPTLNQNTTGSAATLTTPRAIYGNNFDGSAALTQVIASTYGGTGNGFTKFTGATTAERTYTLPDESSTIVVQGGALGTPSSGTVTNLTGTASININGTVGATTPAAGTFTSLSDSGNLTFTGTGNRITGDFSNATVASRVAFQTSTANSNTIFTVLPVGTGAGTFTEYYQSGTDPANSSLLSVGLAGGAGVTRINSTITGTGTYLPMTFYTGGSERMRIDPNGYITMPGSVSVSPRFSVGVGSGAAALTVNDGYGNASVAFNHTAGVPDVSGSSGRISCGVDSSSATMTFQLGNSTTAGVAVALTTVASLSTTGLTVTGTTTSTSFAGPLTGNASTATTATNQSGGTVSATTGSFSGQLSVAQSTTLIGNGINLNAAGSGYLRGTNNDSSSSTQANVQLMSWWGIGFSPSIGGQPVPQGENAVWIDVRNGTLNARSTITAPTFSGALTGNAATATALSTASGSAPSYSARAWVTFNGNTSPGTITGSGNVSSITRASTGIYQVNFATAMPDANYAAVAAQNAGDNVTCSTNGGTKNTAGFRIGVYQPAGVGYLNGSDISAVVFR